MNLTREWIIAKHISTLDDIRMIRVEGDLDKIKDLMVKLVLDDKKAEAECYDGGTWERGSDTPEKVIVDYAEHTLYACGCYADFHIDYTAQPSAYMGYWM